MTVAILGIATCVPEKLVRPEEYEEFARKWAKPHEALEKTLAINTRTGITHRPSISTKDSPSLNLSSPAPIQNIVQTFLTSGLSLALTASQRAITDWGRSPSSITHLICTTCTASSHPGYDLYLHQQLGLPPHCERTLIHGIGCAGGLSIVRLARNICTAEKSRGRQARVLVVALEVTSSLLRAELESLDEEGERGGSRPNVASTIFSDASSAMVVGADGEDGWEEGEHPSFELLECLAETVAGTDEDLAFNIRENGWRAILSTRVPALCAKSVPTLLSRLLSTHLTPPLSSPSLPNLTPTTPPKTFDWFIHTGGSLIISTLSKTLSLAPPSEDPSQTTPSWQMYKERGNASSASIGGVFERGRVLGGREGVVGVAFGPGVTVEMCLMRRLGWRGREVEEGAISVNGSGLKKGVGEGEPEGMARESVNGVKEDGRVNGVKAEESVNGGEMHGTNKVETSKQGVEVSLKNAIARDERRCTCGAQRMFGGSGLDCWCRNQDLESAAPHTRSVFE